MDAEGLEIESVKAIKLGFENRTQGYIHN